MAGCCSITLAWTCLKLQKKFLLPVKHMPLWHSAVICASLFVSLRLLLLNQLWCKMRTRPCYSLFTPRRRCPDCHTTFTSTAHRRRGA
jgi:hypothetical protein